jgi:hypothetical protein
LVFVCFIFEQSEKRIHRGFSFEKTTCTKCTKNTKGHKIRVVIKYKVYLFITNILTVSIYEAQKNVEYDTFAQN